MVNVPFEPDKKNAYMIINNYQKQKMSYKKAYKIKNYILEILHDIDKWSLAKLLENIRENNYIYPLLFVKTNYCESVNNAIKNYTMLKKNSYSWNYIIKKLIFLVNKH